MSFSQPSLPQKSNNTPILVFICFLLLCCVCSRISIRIGPAPDKSDGGVYVQQEGGQPVQQPTNVGEPDNYTLYATYRFGTNQEYADPFSAAQAAKDKLGNRPIKIYCGDLIWESHLDDFLGEADKETILGMTKDDFCPNGGYIEIWPAQ